MRNRAGAFVALVIAAAFAGSAAAQEVQTLKIACVLDAQHPLMVGGRHMAEVVERESKGRLKIALYPSSQLGGQREVLQNVQAGVVDGVLEATATLTNFVHQTARPLDAFAGGREWDRASCASVSSGISVIGHLFGYGAGTNRPHAWSPSER